MASLSKQTALFEQHTAHHAVFRSVADWQIPAHYGNAQEEARRVRESVGLIDRSEIGTFELTGRNLGAWFAGRFGIEVIPPLRSCTVALDSNLTGRWLQLRQDHGFLLTAPEHATATLATLASPSGDRPLLTDITSVYSAFQIAGPNAVALLQKFTSLDLRPARFPEGACAQTAIAKVRAVILHDTIAALPAYWIILTRDYAEFVWESLLHAGISLGLTPFGNDALEMLTKE